MRAAAAAFCNQAGCVYMRSRNTASGTCAERPTVATVGPVTRILVSCEQDALHVYRYGTHYDAQGDRVGHVGMVMAAESAVRG